jgi:hypothetical protein
MFWRMTRSDLRATTHGHGYMRGGKRGGVVHAVTHHGHDGALAGERVHARELVLRAQIGLDLGDAGLARHAPGRAGMIAGEQQHAFALTLGSAMSVLAPARTSSPITKVASSWRASLNSTRVLPPARKAANASSRTGMPAASRKNAAVPRKYRWPLIAPLSPAPGVLSTSVAVWRSSSTVARKARAIGC